jgi:hypothetical protein
MVPLPGNTQAAYGTLIAALEDASDKNDCFVKKGSPINSWFREVAPDCVTFDGQLHLADWKEHESHKGPPKRLSILVRVKETMSRSPLVLTQPTVWVSYYRIEAQGAKLLLTIRFEYDSKQRAHAMFHAQVSDEQIPFEAGDAEGLDFKYTTIPSNPVCMRSARIPTCDMTLPSVLLCLASDHLDKESFSELKSTLLRVAKSMPHPDVSALVASIEDCEPQHLCSSHWFAHVA